MSDMYKMVLGFGPWLECYLAGALESCPQAAQSAQGPSESTCLRLNRLWGQWALNPTSFQPLCLPPYRHSYTLALTTERQARWVGMQSRKMGGHLTQETRHSCWSRTEVIPQGPRKNRETKNPKWTRGKTADNPFRTCQNSMFFSITLPGL